MKMKINFKKIIMVIFIFLLVLGIGYLLGVASMQMASQKDSSGYNRIKNVEDERVVTLMKNLTAGNDCWNIEDYANDHKMNVKNLSSERIFQVVQSGSFSKGTSEVSLEEFTKEIKKYFSIGYHFDPEEIQGIGCNHYSYNANEKMFYRAKIGCADQCESANKSLYQIKDVEDNGFDLKVTIHVLYGSQAESVHFYSDYERLHFVTDDYDHIEKYLEKGDTYLFTFLRVNDHYVFVSSEKV